MAKIDEQNETLLRLEKIESLEKLQEEIRFTIENSFKLEYNIRRKCFRGMEDMITLFCHRVVPVVVKLVLG